MTESSITTHPGYTRVCAALLIAGAVVLTSIGGEAGGDRVLPWLATLAALTIVWLVSLRATSVSPALLIGTAIANPIFMSGQLHNRWFLGALVLAWTVIAVKSRTFLQAAEWGFLATLILSPMIHAWYFVWALPFAVRSKNLGLIAIAASGIAYFLVHHTMTQPGGGWIFPWWQRAIIWLPLITGFAVSVHKTKKPQMN